jgi:hypothetical protein
MAAPATALAYRKRRELRESGSWTGWLPLCALLWHQTEEWVRPGGFLPWFNRDVLGSDTDEYPITRTLGLLINTGMGWAVGILAGTADSRFIRSMQLTLIAGNAAMHLGQARASRSYNPGLASSIVLFVPIAATGLRRELAGDDSGAGRRGAIAGAAASALLMVSMRVRVRRHSRFG